jgi:hypothetical protein
MPHYQFLEFPMNYHSFFGVIDYLSSEKYIHKIIENDYIYDYFLPRLVCKFVEKLVHNCSMFGQ